ncbi:substrate-binding domain-containing protein [Euzebya sp.]|uniref:substrate-binding domain-containing protein n=1 Tax=Euzebya sp. TaxID=1971409 RepID=UPI003515CE5C
MPPVAAAAALVVLAVLAGACDGAAGAADAEIGLLLPESKTARYETYDAPAFEARVAELCGACTTTTANANQDPARQQSQAEAMLTNGVDVLVLDPVDSVAAATIVRQATDAGVPVVSYDRLVLDERVDFHVGFDNGAVGAQQARALVEAIRADGVVGTAEIVMVNGAPTDDNARRFAASAREVFADAGVEVLAEVDVADWSPDQAQELMEQTLTTLGRDRLDGVYVANDGMAGGVIAALRTAGVEPLPPVTGQDAELAAIQRIIRGEQHMTVYKAITTQAAVAAEIAVALLEGADRPAAGIEDVEVVEVAAGDVTVPAVILTPEPVTVDDIAATVVADGFLDVADICTPRLAERCAAAGLGP